MKKLIKPCVLILSILGVLFLTAQSIYFFAVISGSPPIEKADIVVVFQGRIERVQAAHKLMAADRASCLVISPASRKQLESYEQRYQPKRSYEKIIEDKARTTFENALFTSKIIKKNGISSLILVTSWNHTPRSLLLLKSMLAGSNIEIQSHTVPTGKLNRANWYRHNTGWKMMYNEMVECWGSLIEFAKYQMTGKLPRNAPGRSGILGALRKWVLFDIKPEELN